MHALFIYVNGPEIKSASQERMSEGFAILLL